MEITNYTTTYNSIFISAKTIFDLN